MNMGTRLREHGFDFKRHRQRVLKVRKLSSSEHSTAKLIGSQYDEVKPVYVWFNE